MQSHVESPHRLPAPPEPLRGRPSARRLRRRLGLLVGIASVVLAASGCTPEQLAFMAAVREPYEDVLTDVQLERLRQCESGGDYEIVDRSGSFYGAYQFTRRTWNGVASRHFPWLEGADPSQVEPWWQDLMARALYSERGRAPWPVCGRRI